MEIGDIVYHRGIKGNGIIAAKRTGYRDGIGVQFHWLKYKEGTRFHNLGGALEENRGLWCSENKLLLTPKPEFGPNKVSLAGNRSLERLIRLITYLPRRINRDGSKIIINYGNQAAVARVPRTILCLNRNLTINKYDQCIRFKERGLSTPDISLRKVAGYIRKPFYSFGGYGIEEGPNLRAAAEKYFQKKVNKQREFRAHVFLWNENKVPFIQEKIVPDRTQLCWNKHQGGEFIVPYSDLLGIREIDQDLIDKITIQAIGAVKALGHDFGGVDLALDDQGDIYIFEVNSRCGLKELSLLTYKTVFWKLHNINIQGYKRGRWQW